MNLNKYAFWENYRHYELGYKPTEIKEFADQGEAFIYCEAQYPNGCFDDVIGEE